jgi:hypothetical protein
MELVGGLPATISVPLAGRLLGICDTSACDAVRTGQIPVLKLGRRLLVPTARLRDLLGLTNAELQRQLVAWDWTRSPSGRWLRRFEAVMARGRVYKAG